MTNTTDKSTNIHPMPPGIALTVLPADMAQGAGGGGAPAATLTYNNGQLLSTVEVFTIFWGAAWQKPGQSDLPTQLNQFFDFVLSSSLLNLLGEYSVPGQAIFPGRRIGTATITDTEPGTVPRRQTVPGGVRVVTDAQVRTALQGWVGGKIPNPDANTLYFVYLPPGVTYTHPVPGSTSIFISCAPPSLGICGYHDSVGGIFYAVLPYISCGGCLIGGQSTFDSLTKASSHELCEAITNPNQGGWWDKATKNEIGDVCNLNGQRFGPYWIQAEWSNLQNACAMPAGYGSQQHIFYYDTQGHISHIWWDAPTNSFGHDQWDVKAATPIPLGGRPDTMVWPNQQHVFYLDTDTRGHSGGHISHIWWDAPTNGFGQDQWDVKAGAPAPGGEPVTMVWPNQQHIFYQDTQGHISHIWWDAPTNGFGHDQWDVRAGAPAPASDPVTMVWPNQQHIFYQDTQGHISHIWWDAPTDTFGHDQWDISAGAPAPLGGPVTMVWPNQQHIFYRDKEGHISHIWWDAPTDSFGHDQWDVRAGAPAPEAEYYADPVILRIFSTNSM